MLKKTFIALSLVSLVMGMVLAPAVLAQTEIPGGCKMRVELSGRVPDDWQCPGQGEPCEFSEEGSACGLCCTMSVVYYAADLVFLFLIAMVIIFVLWGAFEILQSSGNPDRLDSGRNKIAFAAVGFGLALMARAVPSLVRFLIG